MIPETLEEWTLDVVERLLAQGVFESDRFDFKEMLPQAKGHSEKLRLRKTCAAFANSGGGFLVFGVKDEKGLSVADRLVGLDPTFDFPVQFGSFPSGCEPTVDWTFRNPAVALASGRLVHVVHVPRGARRPHGLDDEGRWYFTKRTNKGNEAMSYGEIQSAFRARGEKLAKVRFVRAEIEHVRETAFYAKTQAGHARLSGWRHPIPAFNLDAAMALFPEVIDLFKDNDPLVKCLQRLRDAVHSADTVRSTNWANAKVVAYQLGNAGEGVLHLADIALPLLRKVEEDVEG